MLNKICCFFEKNKVPALIACVLFTIAYPFVFKSAFAVRMGTLCLMNIMLALSLNLMIGMLGYISFGHAGFWGIGAYTAALLVKNLKWGSFPSMLAAILITGLFGLMLGLTVLKLQGFHFAIVTMVFSEIVRAVEQNWISLTRGPMGISGISKPTFFGIKLTSSTQNYFYIFVLVIITTLLISNIMNSRTGLAVLATRDDNLVASAMGIHTFKYKVMIFVISSMIAGAAGAFYAQYIGYIDSGVFVLTKGNEFLIMTIFGGLGNIVGSFVGAIVLTVLPELLRDLADYRMLLYGMLLVVLMHIRSQGILGDINFKYIRQRRMKREADQRSVAGGGENYG